MFLQIEQKAPAPVWQRCFFGCFAVLGVFILLGQFVSFIVSPIPPTLNSIAYSGFGLSYGLSLFARIAAEGRLSELTPDGKLSAWLRAGFGLGAVISFIGEIRILISVINRETALGTKEEIYLVLMMLLTCAFAYAAIRGKPFVRKPTPTAAPTDSTPPQSQPSDVGD
jgi:hypothetical protein